MCARRASSCTQLAGSRMGKLSSIAQGPMTVALARSSPNAAQRRQSAKSRAASTRARAMPPAHSLTRRLSAVAPRPKTRRDAVRTPQAHPEAGVARGCAALVARKTSSRSPQSHKTYDGSPNWSPDHHQHQPPRVLRNRCGRQCHYVKAGSQWSIRQRAPQKIASAASLS